MKTIICLVVIASLVWAFLLFSSESKVVRSLPEKASNVVEYGNGWSEFSLNGRRFLYHVNNSGYQNASETIVELR